LNKIRVGAVSYLNTKPLLYGIKRSAALMKEIEMIESYPSHIAGLLLNNEIDIGLVPVTVITELKEWHIITDYCIGADGEVASVCLFSEVPLEKIEKILLDYQSRTSVSLCRILLKKYWHINPVLEDASSDFQNNIKGTTAGVLIGDRALQQRTVSPYIYDLAEAWKAMTGLPFVFAAWIANKQLPERFILKFNEANGVGLKNIEEVIEENANVLYNLNAYYTENISYVLNEEKKAGMKLFIKFLKQSRAAT
jgi:chorismate dehydratase